jgi:hypothetical protein
MIKMNQSDYERLNSLSKNSLVEKIFTEELEELNQLVNDWNKSVEFKLLQGLYNQYNIQGIIMANKIMQGLVKMDVGSKISVRLSINQAKVSNWTYANECPSKFSTLHIGVILEVFEVHKEGPFWVKAYIPHSHNTMYLKITGEELSSNFYIAD